MEVVPIFERFTDRARRVVVGAQEEARALDHHYIGTEHLLLGLIAESEGVGAQAMQKLGVSLEAARAQVCERFVDEPRTFMPAAQGMLPFTPRAKKVLELSLREALQLGHNYIGTEHLLLALIREGEGLGAQVLVLLGADLSYARQTVIQILSGYPEAKPRRPVKLEFSPASVDAIAAWVDHFDRANGPLSDDHPLRLLKDALSAADALQRQEDREVS